MITKEKEGDPVREDMIGAAHALRLTGRERAAIEGVSDVELFNEQLVSLTTAAGTLTIMGNSLHISQLDLENGSLLVEGRIDALEYDDRPKRRGLSRLFK